MRRCAASAIAVLLLGWLLASSAGPAQPAQAESAPALRFNVVIDAPRAIRTQLEEGLDIVRWQHDQRMTPELLERLVDEARAATQQALAADGYFSAEVRAQITRENDHATVRIGVEPGARTVVSDVTINLHGEITRGGPEEQKRIDELRRAWPLKPGHPFRQTDWETAKRQTIGKLAAARYAAARLLSSEARIDPQRRTAVLTMDIDSGPIFRVGSIEVTGLKRYPRSIIENLSTLTAGEPYYEDGLLLYQRRLLETGYFATAQLAVDPDPAKADAAPLHINVIEARSQRIDTGVSFSTDTRLRVQLDYTNNDIFDSAYRLHTLARADSQTQSLDVSINQPPQPGGIWMSYTGTLQRTDIQGQRTQEAAVGLARNWGPWSTPSQIGVSLHTERVDVEGSTSDNIHAAVLDYRYAFRRTDALVQPRRGVLGTLELNLAPPGLATRQFERAHLKSTFLWPLGEQDDIALRGEAGIVLATSRFGIPSSFLYRTGGDQSVRGYAYQSIGVTQGNAIVGGRY
ncbi:MAG TPA: POTRA domain-containing protein, partial [Burkholderiales bacterium]|nr:POTRA domain-containing protein [Burkholderiales bacterium]